MMCQMKPTGRQIFRKKHCFTGFIGTTSHFLLASTLSCHYLCHVTSSQDKNRWNFIPDDWSLLHLDRYSTMMIYRYSMIFDDVFQQILDLFFISKYFHVKALYFNIWMNRASIISKLRGPIVDKNNKLDSVKSELSPLNPRNPERQQSVQDTRASKTQSFKTLITMARCHTVWKSS